MPMLEVDWTFSEKDHCSKKREKRARTKSKDVPVSEGLNAKARKLRKSASAHAYAIMYAQKRTWQSDIVLNVLQRLAQSLERPDKLPQAHMQLALVPNLPRLCLPKDQALVELPRDSDRELSPYPLLQKQSRV